ncbi:hypothetical protein CEXT_753901 [Caerostris extrusa]|uniref:Uncharacterized protein n=1 Tax=Caerostris extrusa TaxID=172846 RepID=A0AAV4MLT2_CAEEX|nr:hypothetical protein CEXT_753901 [Caerostris extrusa]
MDQKQLMNLLHLHGAALIRAIVGSSSCENPDEETVEQYILEFIKDKQQQLNKDASNIKEEQKTASAVLKPLPLELYRQDQDILQRRRIFLK